MPAHENVLTRPGFSMRILMDAVASDADLSDRHKRNLRSSLNSFCRYLGRRPEDVPTTISSVRAELAGLHPVQLGVTRKRLANVQADLKFVLRRYHELSPSSPPQRVSPEWAAFLSRCEQPWQRYSLSRLSRFCSGKGISPMEVDDGTIGGYREHLEQHLLAKDPEKVAHQTVQTWNGLSRRGRPIGELTVRKGNAFVTHPLSTYPASFEEDLRRYLDSLGQASPLFARGPAKPLKPVSVRNIKASVRQFAHALVESGVASTQIADLSALVRLENYKLGLSYFYHRNGDEIPSWLSGMAGHLLAIAKYHVRLETAAIMDLRRIKSKVSHETAGFTDKNAKRLAQFDDPRNLALLLSLPATLQKRALRAKRRSSRSALLMLHAVAIEILIVCPIRIGNLAGIHLDDHLLHSGKGKRFKLALYIPGKQVKNGEPIEADFPPETAVLIRDYELNWRGLLAPEANRWLFPAQVGHRHPGVLGNDITKCIYRETGLEMHPHLFRHLALKLLQEARPGELETGRQLLRHRKIETTYRYYAPLQNKWATKFYDEEVLLRLRR